VLSSPHALVFGLLQQIFARGVQRKSYTVVEGGPIDFFDLKGGLIRKCIEKSFIKFKTNRRTNFRTYHVWEMDFLREPFSCSEFIPSDNPFFISIGSNLGMSSIVKVLLIVAYKDFVRGFQFLCGEYYSFQVKSNEPCRGVWAFSLIEA